MRASPIDPLERLQVGEAVSGFGRRQANRVAAHPIDRRLILSGEERRDREANQRTDQKEPITTHVPTPGWCRVGCRV